MRIYQNLIIAMARTGVLGFGGGPSVIPLFQHEVVNTYKWMTEDEFSNLIGISNALPGPIATKLAAQIGYKTKGWLGAIVAIVAHILPTSIGVILFMGILISYKDTDLVAGMIGAIKPVITILLALITMDFLKKSKDNLNWTIAIIALFLAFLALEVLNIHPALVVLVFLLYGSFHHRIVSLYKK